MERRRIEKWLQLETSKTTATNLVDQTLENHPPLHQPGWQRWVFGFQPYYLEPKLKIHERPETLINVKKITSCLWWWFQALARLKIF
jgi:hypothetical protein